MRYVALAGAGGTVVERIRVDGGTIEAVRRLPGELGVPVAAYDGTTTGLSADGRTLVLASALPDRRPWRTRLVVLDTDRLRVRDRIVLRGATMVDALSPDGRWLYLTRYGSDLTGYEVRAYDLAAGRLLRKPIVDPREPDEAMQGLPVARSMSPDGRWAYTLYMRPVGEPFVHALDTRGRTAACIDLPMLEGVDLTGMHLQVREGGATLAVASDAGPRALIDTHSWAVRRPAAPPARRPAPTDGGFPWLVLLLPVAAIIVLATIRSRPPFSRARRMPM
jgi:hypothetical protein